MVFDNFFFFFIFKPENVTRLLHLAVLLMSQRTTLIRFIVVIAHRKR